VTEHLLQLQQSFMIYFDDLKAGFIYSCWVYNGKF